MTTHLEFLAIRITLHIKSICCFFDRSTVWMYEFVIRFDGFVVSPTILPDIDTSLVTSNLPSSNVPYNLLSIDLTSVIDASLTVSVTLDKDIKLPDYAKFATAIQETYTTTGNMSFHLAELCPHYVL